MAVSLSLGTIGGGFFAFAGLPLAWMLGPLVANLLASASGIQVRIPEGVRQVFLGVLGLVLGSQVTPTLVSRVVDWPASISLLLVGVALSTAAAAAWYRRRGFDRVSAWFASAPGAMTAMTILGEQGGGDAKRIAIAQSLRVVLVVLILPPLFSTLGTTTGSGVSPATQGADGIWLLMVLPVVFVVGRRLRLPTPALLGPLLLMSPLSGFDIIRFHLPAWGMNAVLCVLGCSIGTRFLGFSVRRLVKALGEAAVATTIALLILACFAELVHQLVGVGRDVALLALAPGGMGEMAMVAVALDLDPVFVAFHHLLRVVVLMLFAPFWARWLGRHPDS